MNRWLRGQAKKVPRYVWPRVAVGGGVAVLLGIVWAWFVQPLLLVPLVGGPVAVLVAFYGIELAAPGKGGGA